MTTSLLYYSLSRSFGFILSLCFSVMPLHALLALRIELITVLPIDWLINELVGNSLLINYSFKPWLVALYTINLFSVTVVVASILHINRLRESLHALKRQLNPMNVINIIFHISWHWTIPWNDVLDSDAKGNCCTELRLLKPSSLMRLQLPNACHSAHRISLIYWYSSTVL